MADFNEIQPDHRPDKLSPAEVYDEIRDSISIAPWHIRISLVIFHRSFVIKTDGVKKKSSNDSEKKKILFLLDDLERINRMDEDEEFSITITQRLTSRIHVHPRRIASTSY